MDEKIIKDTKVDYMKEKAQERHKRSLNLSPEEKNALNNRIARRVKRKDQMRKSASVNSLGLRTNANRSKIEILKNEIISMKLEIQANSSKLKELMPKKEESTEDFERIGDGKVICKKCKRIFTEKGFKRHKCKV